MTTIAQHGNAAHTRANAPRFYVTMAIVCAMFAFVGFAPTYWAPLAGGRFSAAPVVHLHGMLFFAWTLLFILQTSLAANGHLSRHREFGVLGVSLATAMLFTGTLVAIHRLRTGLAAGEGDVARAFSVVPFTAILLFAVIVTIALLNVRRPQVHKRLMLLATIALLQPAVARWFVWLIPATPGLSPHTAVLRSIVPGAIADLLIVAAVVYDWRTRGRPHPAYLIGGACILAVQLLRVPVGVSPFWLATADWIATLPQ